MGERHPGRRPARCARRGAAGPDGAVRPAGHGEFYLEVQEGSLFREREQMRPMQGDPVRWAAIADGTLHVYSFVVLPDGRYELQIYDRILTDEGIDIRFQRIVDGEIMREITGQTVRADVERGDEE